MAQQLWLLRHGEAEPHSAHEDAARPLTPRGERQARDAGQALARLGVEIDEISSSPRVRALDTARLAGEQLGLEPDVLDSLSDGWDRDDALELLAGHGEDACI